MGAGVPAARPFHAQGPGPVEHVGYRQEHESALHNLNETEPSHIHGDLTHATTMVLRGTSPRPVQYELRAPLLCYATNGRKAPSCVH